MLELYTSPCSNACEICDVFELVVMLELDIVPGNTIVVNGQSHSNSTYLLEVKYLTVLGIID